jgi:glycosyltransferase involved in cell wall biosynthesis
LKIVNLIGSLKNNPNEKMTGPERVFFNLYNKIKENEQVCVSILSSKNPLLFLIRLALGKGDIYHTFQFGISNLLALFVVRLLKRKYFYYTAHGLALKEMQHGSKLKKYHLLVEYLTLKFSSRIIAVSHDLKELIIKHYNIKPSKIDVIGNGVEEYFLLEKPCFNIYKNLGIDSKKIILTATGTQKIKGILPLTQSISYMERDDFVFVIAGPAGNCHNEIARFIDNRKIFYLGNLTRDELLSAYYYAYIYVQNSVYDTFGLAPLEAMATGTPIIISENVQMKYLLNCTSLSDYVVPFINTVNLKMINKINYLLDNQDERDRLGLKAKEIASRNTWDKVAQEYLFFWYKNSYMFCREE